MTSPTIDDLMVEWDAACEGGTWLMFVCLGMGERECRRYHYTSNAGPLNTTGDSEEFACIGKYQFRAISGRSETSHTITHVPSHVY
jgi:hypothetical protein